MRTTKQRMAVLDSAIEKVGAEERRRPSTQTVKIVELLRKYRSWEDAPPDGDDAFLTVHDELDAQFAVLLTRIRDRETSAKMLEVAIEVARLEDSVPWRRGISARLVGAVVRELSVSTWAERVARLPEGPWRDLAAYPVDVVHVLFGDHHGGEECVTVSAAFSEDDTAATRLIGPVYKRVIPYFAA